MNDETVIIFIAMLAVIIAIFCLSAILGYINYENSETRCRETCHFYNSDFIKINIPNCWCQKENDAPFLVPNKYGG